MTNTLSKDEKRISVVDVAVTGIVMMIFAILSVGAGYFINDNTPYEPQAVIEQKSVDVVKPQQAETVSKDFGSSQLSNQVKTESPNKDLASKIQALRDGGSTLFIIAIALIFYMKVIMPVTRA